MDLWESIYALELGPLPFIHSKLCRFHNQCPASFKPHITINFKVKITGSRNKRATLRDSKQLSRLVKTGRRAAAQVRDRL